MIEGIDSLYEEAEGYTIRNQKVSASLLQRFLQIGYARAANILRQLEENGVVGPAKGSKLREILKDESTLSHEFREIYVRPGNLVVDLLRKNDIALCVCIHGKIWNEGASDESVCQKCINHKSTKKGVANNSIQFKI